MVYDLIIVGGGMSGISVGHFFRDRHILLLEKGGLLQEASGKNAGFLISGFGEHYNNTAGRWGKTRAREIQEIHRSSHRRIRELAIELDCTYEKTGSYAVALTDQEKNDLAQSYKLMRSEGFDPDWEDEPAVGLTQTSGALFNVEDGWIDPQQFWKRLAEGLPVQTACEVFDVLSDAANIRVQTSNGDYLAKRVVFCLNAFGGKIVSETADRYIALRGQMLEMPTLRSPGHSPVFAQYGDIYWRFKENSLIFGGLEWTVPEEETGIAHAVSDRIQQDQLNWIRKHFDQQWIAPDAVPSRSWCSTMAFSVDGFPFVGELERRNCFVLSALCGLGHSYALECASWLHALIVEQRNVIPAYFSAARLVRLPKFAGGNWRTQNEAWNH